MICAGLGVWQYHRLIVVCAPGVMGYRSTLIVHNLSMQYVRLFHADTSDVEPLMI